LLDAAVLALSVVEPFRTLLPQMIAHDPVPRLTMRAVAERLHA
jgi:hypothetical protein